MHKIVKSSRVVSHSSSIYIDNTVVVPEVIPQIEDEKEEEILYTKDDFLKEIEKYKALYKSEADRIISNAKDEASKIIDDAIMQSIVTKNNAEKDIELLKQTVSARAFNQGFSEGKTEITEKLSDNLAATVKLLEEINQRKESYYNENEEDLKDLVLEMVKKITLTKLSEDDEILLNVLRQAAKSFRNSDYIKISFSQADVEVNKNALTDAKFIRSIIGDIPEIDIEIIPSADEGTVILDNGREIIDASVPTQLDLLKEIMKNKKSKRP